MHDCHDSFFGSGLAKAAVERSKAGFGLFHSNEGARVLGARAGAEAAHHALVARELQVAVGEHVHGPDQRVEPVHAHARHEHELGQGIEAPHVHQLVGQHVAHLALARPVGIARHQDHRTQHTVGERRRDEVGPAQAQRPAQLPAVLCKPRLGAGVVHRQRRRKVAAAPQVDRRKAGSAQHRPHRPDHGQGGGEGLKGPGVLRHGGVGGIGLGGRSRCGGVHGVRRRRDRVGGRGVLRRRGCAGAGGRRRSCGGCRRGRGIHCRRVGRRKNPVGCRGILP